MCVCRDVGRVQEGLGEKLGLLLQWLATLVAGVIVSLVTEWRLTLLMGFAGLLIAASTALLSVVRVYTVSGALFLIWQELVVMLTFCGFCITHY